MQYHALTVALIGLIGVLLGGGVRAAEAWYSRRLDAHALLSALVAEVEMLCRLIEHRKFALMLADYRDQAQAMIDNGHGEDEAPIFVVDARSNYFSVYEASLPKIGLLEPYFVDRITRFYAYLKSANENYHPESRGQQGVSAYQAVITYESDLQLLLTALQMGRAISANRTLKVPRGINDPFFNAQLEEPPLPPSVTPNR